MSVKDTIGTQRPHTKQNEDKPKCITLEMNFENLI